MIDLGLTRPPCAVLFLYFSVVSLHSTCFPLPSGCQSQACVQPYSTLRQPWIKCRATITHCQHLNSLVSAVGTNCAVCDGQDLHEYMERCGDGSICGERQCGSLTIIKRWEHKVEDLPCT